MSGPVETHRSFVNTWECDENAHMNVQFYFRRFDEAARFFAQARAGEGLDAALPATRHVRFHSELAGATLARIHSAVVAEGAFAGWIVHRMENAVTGRLAATSLEPPRPGVDAPAADAGFHEPALPRSMTAEPAAPLTPDEMIAGEGLLANRAIVQPAQCDAAGRLLEQFHISIFSDAAPHVWEHTGIGVEWLNRNGFGRVAVEMKITHHRPVRAGDGLAVYSRATANGGKTMHLHHEIVTTADGRPVASGEVIGLVLDLKTRKSVAIPAGAFRG